MGSDKRLTFDDFLRVYTLVENPNALDEEDKFVFNDISYLRTLDPRTVWTVVDGDDGSIWLTPGLRIVNRIYHFVTVERWDDDTPDYLMPTMEDLY